MHRVSDVFSFHSRSVISALGSEHAEEWERLFDGDKFNVRRSAPWGGGGISAVLKDTLAESCISEAAFTPHWGSLSLIDVTASQHKSPLFLCVNNSLKGFITTPPHTHPHTPSSREEKHLNFYVKRKRSSLLKWARSEQLNVLHAGVCVCVCVWVGGVL